MKQIFIIFLIFIVSCEAPRQRRTNYSPTTNSLSGTVYDPNRTNTNNGNTTSTTTVDNTTTSDTSTGQTNTEISHCNFADSASGSFIYNSGQFGPYNICQSSTDPATIYLQFKNQFNARVAFVPLRATSSDSMFLGEPMYVDHVKGAPSINKITIMTSSTRITGRESYSMNGLMMMRDDQQYYYSSPYPNYRYYPVYAYFLCMCWKEGNTQTCPYSDLRYCSSFSQAGTYDYITF
ncbi:MAG: hypothetical protein H6622_06015 [Halobacteriovoraceae bacterium]|nr:hypothetical protein [Halobacteriovoraceae bacterium]